MNTHTNINGGEFHGSNAAKLDTALDINHYPTGIWGSYRQLQGAGYQVQKGEKGTHLARPTKKNGKDTFRSYAVFNVAQCKPVEVEQAAPVEQKATPVPPVPQPQPAPTIAPVQKHKPGQQSIADLFRSQLQKEAS
jgi:antirestriction protein ArdC